MHGCRLFLIIVRLGNGYCRLLRQQTGGQVVRQRGKVSRGSKKGGGRTDKKRSMRGGCRLLSGMFTVVCTGFSWVCVRMVTVFDEMYDYFRKELRSYGYFC